jgi:hypothetical protein
MTWIPGSLDGFTLEAAIGVSIALIIAAVVVLLTLNREQKEHY